MFEKLFSFLFGGKSNIYPLGALLNELDIRDIRLSSFQKPEEIPESYLTDISMLPIMDQKAIPSCVGQAEGTILAYFDFLENKNTSVSKRYIYARAKAEDGFPNGQGTYPRVAATIISKNGSPMTSFVPDDNDLPYAYYLAIPGNSTSLVADAAKRKANFASVSLDLESLKQAIYKNKLVSITLPVDWSAFRRDGTLRKPNTAKIAGYHRIVLVGWIKNDLYFRNSWGEKWGKNGYGHFDFDDYSGLMLDALAYTDIPNEILEEAKQKPFTFTRTLRFGMTGADVKKLQELLSVKPTDGWFGKITKMAVVKLQAGNGLVADGIVGPKTIAKLNYPAFFTSTLENAIIKVESEGNLFAIGDKNLKDKAYGCMQIRRPALEDVNKALGTKMKPEEMLGNLNLSVFVFREYQKIYNPNGSDEEKARCWNGGPGWKKRPYLTDKYWSAVKKLL